MECRAAQVWIRVWYDQTFLDWWQSRDDKPQVDNWFNEVRAQYLNNARLQNVDLFLLKDNYPLHSGVPAFLRREYLEFWQKEVFDFTPCATQDT